MTLFWEKWMPGKAASDIICRPHKNTRPSDVQIGDNVLVNWHESHKPMPRFNLEPYKVVDVRGPLITA